MLTPEQMLKAQRVLLNIQAISQFGSKNIQETYVVSTLVEELYEQLEKLHVIIDSDKPTPKSRG